MLWETKEPSANSDRPLAGMIGVGDRLYVSMKIGETTVIQAFAMANGKPLGQWTVDHPPLRDGLAAAEVARRGSTPRKSGGLIIAGNEQLALAA